MTRNGKVSGGAVLAAALTLLVSPAVRAEDPLRADPVVVTATRIPERVSEQASSVSVVTAEEASLKLPEVAGDALQGLPGVVIQREGSPGNLENIRIRGGKATGTLVMIDGFPVNSPTLGSFDIGSLQMGAFDRVEIVRGAQSALYGSNAMSGVVNFVPKNGKGPFQAGAGVAGGSYDSVLWNGFVQGGGAAGSAYLGVEGFRSQGILPNDDTDTVNFLGTGEVAVGSRSRLHLVAQSYDQKKQVPIDYFALRDPNHENSRQGVLGGGRWEFAATGRTKVTLYGGANYELFDIDDPSNPGELYSYHSRTRTWREVIGLLGEVAIGSSTTFLGAEFQEDRATNQYQDEYLDPQFPYSSSKVTEGKTINRALYLQEELRPTKSLGFSLGVRMDDNSEVGTKFNPRAGAFWVIQPIGARIRAAAGTGFRVPTILEKTDPDAGNISLTKESVVSWEAGADVHFVDRKVQASATYFSQDFRDMIQYDNKYTFRLANVQASSRGVEVGVLIQPVPEAGAELMYTWTDSWDETLSQPILGTPRNRGQVAFLLAPAPGWEGRVEWLAESGQMDAPMNGETPWRSGYSVVNAYARYRWKKPVWELRKVAFTGRVLNLLDRQYESRRGVPAPGVNFLLGVEVAL
jgi:vitamin B12 transporter